VTVLPSPLLSSYWRAGYADSLTVMLNDAESAGQRAEEPIYPTRGTPTGLMDFTWQQTPLAPEPHAHFRRKRSPGTSYRVRGFSAPNLYNYEWPP